MRQHFRPFSTWWVLLSPSWILICKPPVSGIWLLKRKLYLGPWVKYEILYFEGIPTPFSAHLFAIRGMFFFKTALGAKLMTSSFLLKSISTRQIFYTFKTTRLFRLPNYKHGKSFCVNIPNSHSGNTNFACFLPRAIFLFSCQDLVRQTLILTRIRNRTKHFKSNSTFSFSEQFERFRF